MRHVKKGSVRQIKLFRHMRAVLGVDNHRLQEVATIEEELTRH